MRFTNVVWESRGTVQLARHLTDGLGPASVGRAGAAWVRVANEFAAVCADYDKVLERLKGAWEGESSTAAVSKLETLGKWLHDMSLPAATNGHRAEEAAAANTEAVLEMPTTSEAVQAKDTQDMMASLAAYNGAILNSRFAEFDEAARGANHANAATVMRQYADAVTALAQSWEPPLSEEGSDAASPAADRAAPAGGKAVAGTAGADAAPMPLAAWTAPNVKSSADLERVQRVAFSASQAGLGDMGAGGYAPMAASRGSNTREFESTRPAGTLEGGGEPGARLSELGQSRAWQPAAQEAEFTVSSVSRGPNSALFDELAVPASLEPEGFAERPERTLEQISDRWVSPPVIGGRGEVRP